MRDIVDRANEQAQRELDALLSQTATAPANSVYDCVECDNAIGIERKAAVPWATRCIDCQQRYERKR